MANHARALDALFRETVALYFQLTGDAAAIHGAGDLSGPRRTILMGFAEAGPRTVAHLARTRAQSRQRLQPVINALVREGLLQPLHNPMHKRSPLMILTAEGAKRVRQMVKTEAALTARLRPASSVADLSKAAVVLSDVRETLQRQLPGLIERSGPPRQRRPSRVATLPTRLAVSARTRS